MSKGIKQLRERKGLTQKQLAEILGVKFQSVQQWENGESKPSSKRLSALATALDVTINDLLTTGLIDAEEGINLVGNVNTIQKNSTELFIQVPFLNAKALANLNMKNENNCELRHEETYPVYVNNLTLNERHVVIEVAGQDMEPEIKQGAVVLAQRIDSQDYADETGGVYAVWYANRFVVRRIKQNSIREEGKLMLYADNERYGYVTIRGEDIKCMWKIERKVSEQVR